MQINALCEYRKFLALAFAFLLLASTLEAFAGIPAAQAAEMVPVTLAGHTREVFALAYSPDGRSLASGSNNNTIKIWDAASGFRVADALNGCCLRTLGSDLQGHTGHVNAIAYSPNGRSLASASDDKTIKIWPGWCLQLTNDEALKQTQTLKANSHSSNDLGFATDLNNLAALYYTQGKYAEAEPLYKRSLQIVEKVLGPNHQAVAAFLLDMAILHYKQGKYEEAEPLFKRSLQISEKVLGPNHPDVAISLENYAALLRKTNRNAEAAELEARAQAIRAIKERLKNNFRN